MIHHAVRDNWNKILDLCEVAIRAIGPGTSPNWKEDREFYSQAALGFRFFKDAWRNHVAHGRATYSEQRADSVYEHVKAFMQHLATRLKERPAA